MLKTCLIIVSVIILCIAISKKVFADAVKTKQLWDAFMRFVKGGGKDG